MTRRRQRFLLLAAGLAALGVAAWLVLSAFQKNLVFFFTPTQVAAGEVPSGRSFRLGGMVQQGSLRRSADGLGVSFIVTDMRRQQQVRYRGILPDLFKEGKGVVAQGKLGADLLFVADEVLAKHDENYMPPEAAYALAQGKQASGQARQAEALPGASAAAAAAAAAEETR
ncbi:cytochrome c maturation protein CcmE [Pseudoduganella sp. LjRoot289]|uniref:cytochrome c maturation protein CcmE n=1 Tax=Pseudoduganella sp. LjRoot289 TaxID=3342314 RepID=UPI003ECD6C1A